MPAARRCSSSICRARRRRRARLTAPSANASPTPGRSSPVYWLTVGLVLGSAYEQATRELPPNADPAEYLVILPCWGGRVSRDYGVRNTGRAAAVVVVDEDSSVTVSYQGERPVEAVLEALENG